MASVYSRVQTVAALTPIDAVAAVEAAIIAYSRGEMVVPPSDDLLFDALQSERRVTLQTSSGRRVAHRYTNRSGRCSCGQVSRSAECHLHRGSVAGTQTRLQFDYLRHVTIGRHFRLYGLVPLNEPASYRSRPLRLKWWPRHNERCPRQLPPCIRDLRRNL